MDITNVLSQVLSASFIVLGLSMIFNRTRTAEAVGEIARSRGMLWLAGLVTVLLGAAVVGFSAGWTFGLPFMVRSLGWLTLIKGAAIMLFPDATVSYYRKMSGKNVMVVGGAFVLVLGVALMGLQ